MKCRDKNSHKFDEQFIDLIKFDKYFPSEQLRPYIKYFVVSETELESRYKVFPSAGLVLGFQYKGQLSSINNEKIHRLSSAGITGISDSYKTFKNSAGIGTILVFFTETGFIHFTSYPTHELFNQSISLDYIFNKNDIVEIEEQLALAHTGKQRIRVVERFMFSQLKDIYTDKLIVEAAKLIYLSKGTIRIKELNEKLSISPSPFEKRFRKMVGTTPKKFASIVRFNSILANINKAKSLTEICYENNFFDQAHFIKDFKQFTGDTPENFKRLL
jgi:AraC-like DNA-binding protein